MAKQPLPKSGSDPSLSTSTRVNASTHTLVTVLLLLHFFSLFIGIVSNMGASSPFRSALRNVPLVPDYLQLLGMDQSYDFPLTLGPPESGNYRLQIKPVGESEEALMQLPDDSMEPRIRRQRYENLAMRIADLVSLYDGDPHHQTLLAGDIANRILQEFNLPAGEYQLDIERLAPQSLEGVLLGLAPEVAEVVVGMHLLVNGPEDFRLALREDEKLTAAVRVEKGEK